MQGVWAAWLLCPLFVLSSSSSSPSSRGGKKGASWEEVNVLAHGLLQLGRGLREHVERTRGHLQDLTQRLHALREEQNVVSVQSARIEELSQKLKQQQYRMDKQNLQIKSLQSKVNLLLPFHLKAGHVVDVVEGGKRDSGRNHPANHSREGEGTTTTTDKASEASGLPSGCHRISLDNGGKNSGVFRIQPPGSSPFDVFCELTPGDGGWTVIQRRLDGSVDFDRLWDEYRDGFGNLTGEFWLGLEPVRHALGGGAFRLEVELWDWEGGSHREELLAAPLPPEEHAYALRHLPPTTTDTTASAPRPFSTRDRDHDLRPDANCAKHLSGGWWFGACGQANLNGRYFRSLPRQRHERKQGIFWKTWKGRYYPLRATTIRVRPVEEEPLAP
ncbi:angiopoietin-related protein 4 isoform X2 [Anolis carolinensis]|uniref:angiopoietin-related protein 4 isoform X2 n=1 Tax=Anolis carolinensis TaxID=28377 RepID=UPI002F2B567E